MKDENRDSQIEHIPFGGLPEGLISFDSRRARLPRPLAAASQLHGRGFHKGHPPEEDWRGLGVYP